MIRIITATEALAVERALEAGMDALESNDIEESMEQMKEAHLIICSLQQKSLEEFLEGVE